MPKTNFPAGFWGNHELLGMANSANYNSVKTTFDLYD
jgi:hypothetical protein